MTVSEQTKEKRAMQDESGTELLLKKYQKLLHENSSLRELNAVYCKAVETERAKTREAQKENFKYREINLFLTRELEELKIKLLLLSKSKEKE